jgi:hypothetical protein
MTRALLAAWLLLAGTACTTTERVAGTEGKAEYAISCTYFGWYVCYDKAKAICPDYKVVTENEALNRRELRIACPRG